MGSQKFEWTSILHQPKWIVRQLWSHKAIGYVNEVHDDGGNKVDSNDD